MKQLQEAKAATLQLTVLAMELNSKVQQLPDEIEDMEHAFAVAKQWKEIAPVINCIANVLTVQAAKLDEASREHQRMFDEAIEEGR